MDLDRICGLLNECEEHEKNGNIEGAIQCYKKVRDLYVSDIQSQCSSKEQINHVQENILLFTSRIEQLKHMKIEQIQCESNNCEDEENKKLKDRIKSTMFKKTVKTTFNDICGMDSEKSFLRTSIIVPIRQPHLLSKSDRRYKGCLLYGPPGTGKTFLAEAAAGTSGASFLNITVSDLLSKYVGESETLVKMLFEVAHENIPAIIFLDEIDCLVSSRRDGGTGSGIQGELLTQLNNIRKGVFIIAATNFPNNLDKALLRRFSKPMYVGLPSKEVRIQLFKNFLSPYSFKDEDFEEFSKNTDGFSPAEIESIITGAENNSVEVMLRDFKYFKQDKTGFFVPTKEKKNAVTFEEVPKGKLKFLPTVTKEDVILHIKSGIRLTTKEDLKKYDNFRNKDVVKKHDPPPKLTKAEKVVYSISSACNSIF